MLEQHERDEVFTWPVSPGGRPGDRQLIDPSVRAEIKKNKKNFEKFLRTRWKTRPNKTINEPSLQLAFRVANETERTSNLPPPPTFPKKEKKDASATANRPGSCLSVRIDGE